MCASCAQSKKVNHDLASILSVQLATKPKKLLCPRIAELAVAELEVFFPRSRPQTPEYPGENPGNERKSQKAPVAASFLSSGLAGTRSFLGTMLSFSSLCHLFEPSDGASEEYASDESPEFSQDEGNSNVPKSKLTASGSLFDVPPKALQDPKSRLKIPMKSASYDDLPLLQKSHRKQKDQMKQGTGTLYREILAAKSRNSALSQANSMESLNSIVTDTDSLLENPAMELLTYSLFERAVDIYSPELLGKDSVGGVRDPSFLLDSISAVFSSRRALSMSFLREDDHDTLDIRSLQNFFSLFSRLVSLFMRYIRSLQSHPKIHRRHRTLSKPVWWTQSKFYYQS